MAACLDRLAAHPVSPGGRPYDGLYTFKDSFGYQDSVIFAGNMAGGAARVTATAVRKDVSSNFTAELTGRPAAMEGEMMSGTSQRPVRYCTLALTRGR